MLQGQLPEDDVEEPVVNDHEKLATSALPERLLTTGGVAPPLTITV
jgi:hypothetical protein